MISCTQSWSRLYYIYSVQLSESLVSTFMMSCIFGACIKWCSIYKGRFHMILRTKSWSRLSWWIWIFFACIKLFCDECSVRMYVKRCRMHSSGALLHDFMCRHLAWCHVPRVGELTCIQSVQWVDFLHDLIYRDLMSRTESWTVDLLHVQWDDLLHVQRVWYLAWSHVQSWPGSRLSYTCSVNLKGWGSVVFFGKWGGMRASFF